MISSAKVEQTDAVIWTRHPPGARDGALLERQKADLSFPLSFKATLSEQKNLVDGLTYRQRLVHFKDASHRQSTGDSRLSELAHGCNIMGEQYASLGGCPLEHFAIIVPLLARQHILYSDDIESSLAAPYPAQDPVIEVLVDNKFDHAFLCFTKSAPCVSTALVFLKRLRLRRLQTDSQIVRLLALVLRFV